MPDGRPPDASANPDVYCYLKTTWNNDGVDGFEQQSKLLWKNQGLMNDDNTADSKCGSIPNKSFLILKP